MDVIMGQKYMNKFSPLAIIQKSCEIKSSVPRGT